MRINAKFEKVSKNQFLADFKDTFNMSDEEILNIYDNLKLPKRATKGSAGYDFYAPIKIVLNPGENIFALSCRMVRCIDCSVHNGLALFACQRLPSV